MARQNHQTVMFYDVLIVAFRDTRFSRPPTSVRPHALLGDPESALSFDAPVGAGWTTWVPGVTLVCLAHSDRQDPGGEVENRCFTTTPHDLMLRCSTKDQARCWLVWGGRVVGSREDGGSSNAAGLLIVSVAAKMGGSGHSQGGPASALRFNFNYYHTGGGHNRDAAA